MLPGTRRGGVAVLELENIASPISCNALVHLCTMTMESERAYIYKAWTASDIEHDALACFVVLHTRAVYIS